MENSYSFKSSFANSPIGISHGSVIGTVSLFCFLAYFPTFFNSFQLAWDDTWQVLENPLVQQPSWESILFHFTHFWQGQYSPVNSLFYLLINQVFGMNASVFHVACLVIHVINVGLVFSISIHVFVRFLPLANLNPLYMPSFRR